MADRFKVQTDERVLFKGPLVYRQSKWGRVSCQGVLTTRRLVLGRKLNPMWGWGVRLYVLFAGRKIEFQIPLDHLDSVRHDEEENELYFILKTTEDLEYQIRSDSLVGKNNNEWINAISDAVRKADPGVSVIAKKNSVEFDRAGSGRTRSPSAEAIAQPKPSIPLVNSEPQPARYKQIIAVVSLVALVLIAGVLAIIAVRYVWNHPATPPAPKRMVYVPGGEFMMGRDDGPVFERPAHKVTVRPFFIDKYEVTNEEFNACIVAGACHPALLPRGWIADPSGRGVTFAPGTSRQPVTGLFWQDGEQYAEWAGKRLPSEEEWEFAARGTDGRCYPWGNEWVGGIANVDRSGPLLNDVGTVQDISPFGVFDMSGNASEWTTGKFIPYQGGSWQLVLISLNQERVRAYKLTMLDVARTLWAGDLEVQDTGLPDWFLVLPKKHLADLNLINDAVIAVRSSYDVKIRDIAVVEEVRQSTNVLRGGSYRSKQEEATTTFRRTFTPAGTIDRKEIEDRGFRCAKDIQK